MELVDPASVRQFLEAAIAAFSVLGGLMAYFSGYNAHRAVARGDSPQAVAHRINEGVGEGFEAGRPTAVLALMIMGWT